MNKTKNHKLTGISKVLRKNMTPEERHLWYDFLKNLPYTVNRQKVIGKYVVDFYCAAANLVIELDGIQHSYEKTVIEDAERDEYLNSLGITVIRLSNYNIKTNFNGVCEYLYEYITNTANKASPLGEAGTTQL